MPQVQSESSFPEGHVITCIICTSSSGAHGSYY